MRIIAGAHRGLRLDTLSGVHTRPTADRVKEAIFSSLGNYLVDAHILDLFAGSGALGLEALSRGAAHATFVEHYGPARKVVEKNIVRAHEETHSEVIAWDARRFLETTSEQYDLVFMDPPYASDLYLPCLKIIEKRKLLRPNGRIVVESAKNTLFSLDDTVFLLYKWKVYGETKVSYLTLPELKQEEYSWKF